MYENIMEAKRQLEIEANETANMELPADIFNEFFTYLINFAVHPDICTLSSVVSSQIEKIIETVFQSIIDDGDSIFRNITLDDERKGCLMNATKPFTQTDTNILTNYLGRLLYDYSEFVKSIYLAEEVINQVRLHTFSPSCVSALVRMKYCAICGGYTGHAPCLNLCLNTFRGCFADVAEMHVPFASLVELLREHTMDFLPNLQIEAIRNGLSNIVSLIGNLFTNKNDLKAAVSYTI